MAQLSTLRKRRCEAATRCAPRHAPPRPAVGVGTADTRGTRLGSTSDTSPEAESKRTSGKWLSGPQGAGRGLRSQAPSLRRVPGWETGKGGFGEPGRHPQGTAPAWRRDGRTGEAGEHRHVQPPQLSAPGAHGSSPPSPRTEPTALRAPTSTVPTLRDIRPANTGETPGPKPLQT